jgi:hypothetical protein
MTYPSAAEAERALYPMSAYLCVFLHELTFPIAERFLIRLSVL